MMMSEFLEAMSTDFTVTQNQEKIKIGIFLRQEAIHQCTQYAKQNPPYRALSG